MDDLKPTDDSTKEPISQPGDQPADSQTDTPQPTPPEPAPTAPSVPPAIEPEKQSEPSSQTVPTQKTVTTEEPPSTPPPVIGKPSGKKVPRAMTISGALILLLLAASLPAAIVLVQNKTYFAPKAEEPAKKPRPSHPETGKVFKVLSPEQQESEITESIKPRNLKTEIISPESVKITFNTLGTFPSSIIYSPDEDWNYLNMFELGDLADEWRERYNPENQKTIYPVGGKAASTDHEFIFENLIPDHKYYFAIQIEKPEEETVYEFGFEQPEGHFVFITE